MIFNQRIVNLAAAAESETDSLTEAVAEYGSMAGAGGGEGELPSLLYLFST